MPTIFHLNYILYILKDSITLTSHNNNNNNNNNNNKSQNEMTKESGI
jgi:hypothetical protein